ncbi:translocase of chloroplast 159, chloroplastic [Henckelia pumila]|uniref:translocase of chloroplast 159, chloroplastic n=1 Tax=Henckelia pumila TaxID=405737 RepID=UPI003C6E4BAD
MDSKEGNSNPSSEAASGSSLSSSSYSTENDNLQKKNDANDDNDDKSKKIGGSSVFDDEEEGGYVSGKEEFEAGLENPGLDGPDGAVNDGKFIGDGNSHGSYVDALGVSDEKVETLPVSGVLVGADDVENVNKAAEGKEVALVQDSGSVSAAADDVNGAELNGVVGSAGKGGVKSGGEVQDGNLGKEFEEKGDIETEESKLVGPGDVKLTSEGDSVVDTIQIDAAGPGVVVVGETEDDGDGKTTEMEAPAVDPTEESQVVGPGDVKLTTEGDSVVDTIQVDDAGPGVVVVGETEDDGDVKTTEMDAPAVAEESQLVGPGDVKLATEGDSVVDTIQVDAAGPGVSVVGETEDDGNVKTKEMDAPAVDPKEESQVVGPGDVKLTSEGDSVVDTIQVDAAGPGVAVVGETEENGEVKTEEMDAPAVGPTEESKVVGPGDVKLTPEGDSVVDTIQVDAAGPGVAVVGENGDVKTEEMDAPVVSSNGGKETVSTREVGVECLSSEPATENNADAMQTNGEHDSGVNKLGDGVSKESKATNAVESKAVHPQEITELEGEEVEPVDSMSEGDTDGMIFGSSEAARKFIEELEQESGMGSHAGADSSFEQSQRVDGQIVTDSEEEADTDDEGDGKGLFDSAALAALLKAATGADTDGGSITITSQDGSRHFSVERPAGLGSSLRSLRPASGPALAPRPNQPNLFSPSTFTAGGESEANLSEEEKKKLENLQKIRVKFLRLVHRLGVSPEESVAAQVLYRLALLGGRQNSQTFSLDAAKRMALQLEEDERDSLDFSINILVLGKSGLGKSATINSIFGQDMSPIDAFEVGTASVKEISGFVDGVKVRVVDTPGLKSSAMEQASNRNVLSSAKKFTKKCPPDVMLYVDRLDAQTRDLNDLPLLRTITSALGPSIWRSAIVTLTHAASAPPDGPSGTPLSYEVFVTQRSHIVQQSIGHAVGDLRMMSPSLMNPVSLVENHPSCRKNREGQKILPNGQSWRPQLLLLCYAMKILSEASSLSKPQDPFDHRKIFGFRSRAPPLPYMLSSMLQSRAHPKLPSDQGGDSVDSDVDLDELSDSDHEEEDEYDQLPPFRPLKKAQLAKLSKEQRKAYFEEYDYRVKLLQKKQWKEELKRLREIKKKGTDVTTGFGAEDDTDPGAAAPVAVPLPDMALPPSFDGDNPSHRYRFLEPTSQFLARPVLDTHGWDHDCGYDGVNLEHSFAIANRFPAVYTIQITKDKKDFSVSLDSSIAAKHGDDNSMSTMAGFDIQSMGKQLAYILRGETKFNKLKKNKAAAGLSVTFLGDNVVPGVKVEDQITLGKQYVLVGGAGAVRSQNDTAYGANFELQRRENDYPIGQVQSTFSMSIIKWKGDLALGFNTLAQFSVGRNSKVAVRAGINNKLSGQVTVRTSSSEHISLALAAIIPTAISIYKKLWAGANDKYSIY